MMNQDDLTEDLDHILDHTKEILEEFRNSRIFITGGTGFFGIWLLETFARANKKLNLNVEIVTLSRNPARFTKRFPHFAKNPFFHFVTGDIRDFSFPTGSFKYVFHLATEASDDLNRNEPLKMFDVIVEGTRHILDFAVSAGVQGLLLASSGAVYGRQPYEISHVCETYNGGPDPSNPLSAYGEGKRVAELLGTLYAKKTGLEFKIARCFAFVGPYLPLDKHFAIGNFILDSVKKQPVIIKGDGTPLRSYLYASDLIVWLLTVLVKGNTCTPYNVGSDQAISIADLAKKISSCFDYPVEIKVTSQPQTNIKPEQYIPSVTRANSELGLKVTVDIVRGIQKTIRFAEHYYNEL